ncbi:MAG: DNA methyltransferase [Methylibium sp. NZG]|nr:MAG: DNA methyltransferase [Methylibium sp. NZG]
MNASTLVQKLWNYCNILRDDGLSYGDYVEQLTFLLFLKMADEKTKPPFNQKPIVDAPWHWPELLKLDADPLEMHYRHTLEALGKADGVIGVIFRKAQNKIQDPAKLKRLIVDLIDKEDWSALDTDLKGDAYEGLLQKNAEDVKGGAGQYFTPRALIQGIVEVMNLKLGETICDPACGTAGFLLAAHTELRKQGPSKAQLKHLNTQALTGVELVDSVARLACMNLVLHGVGADDTAVVPVQVRDALSGKHGEYDVILANPPFGKKSSVTITSDEGDVSRETLTIHRDDFWATTSNKQLNFVQHIFSSLKMHGRAAVVLPDNVLFEGGAGETVRRELLKQSELHTILRLPTGLFYAQGVKANVLFFDRKPPRPDGQPNTERVWFYDLRTNQHFTLKTRPLQHADMNEFVRLYRADNRLTRADTFGENNPQGRWRSYGADELLARDKASLDLFWLKDDSLSGSDNLPAPELIAAEIIDDLQAALDQLKELESDLHLRTNF